MVHEKSVTAILDAWILSSQAMHGYTTNTTSEVKAF